MFIQSKKIIEKQNGRLNFINNTNNTVMHNLNTNDLMLTKYKKKTYNTIKYNTTSNIPNEQKNVESLTVT